MIYNNVYIILYSAVSIISGITLLILVVLKIHKVLHYCDHDYEEIKKPLSTSSPILITVRRCRKCKREINERFDKIILK